MKEKEEGDDYISDAEREHLLSELHRFLAWVGEQLPDEIEVDGEKIDINDFVWSCIHNKQISDEEKIRISNLVRLLETKEKYDEDALIHAKITREEALRLYHESAGLLRAIMDIRECGSGKIKLKCTDDVMEHKINDAKRWLGFLKGVGKKE